MPKKDSKATTLYLVRHGETEWNRSGRYQGQSDPPLSETGRAEAAGAAERLAKVRLAAIYTSDLRRAVETAAAVRDRQGEPLPLHCRPELREIHFGLWEGLTFGEIEAVWAGRIKRWYDDPAAVTPPGGEAFTEFRRRVLSCVRRIAEDHVAEAVAVVTHGGVITLILAGEGRMPFRNDRDLPVASGEVRKLEISAFPG